MRVLSLFDGMACGMIAMKLAGVPVEQYDAYEIDKYAVQAASHNFPDIKQHGDVFVADFTQYDGVDFLVGGSPCTYWSIAQSPDKRETTASGIGWELFSQYVRALHEAKPRMFIYENNKSMSRVIRASITETFGFEPILINSALVSAQNRQRLYWVGVRNDDGTYRKANIKQPEDRGILLKDVLDSAQAFRNKAYCVTASEYKGQSIDSTLEKHRRTQVAEPIETPLHDKMYTLDAQYGKTAGAYNPEKQHSYSRHAVAVPACVASRGRNPENFSDRTPGAPTEQHFEAHEDGKTNTITSVQKDNLVAEPVCCRYERSDEAKRVRAAYERGEVHHGFHELHELQPRTDGKSNTLSTVQKDNPIIEPIRVGTMPRERDGAQTQGMAYRVYGEDGKSITLKGESGGCGGGGKSGLYALHEKPKKEQRVYTVQDGQIEVNGKRYPIKLKDGQYIIRKLTVTECMRLQTVPEWYDFSCVSNTQAYKMLGNGWTCEVIAHLIRGAIKSSILGI